MALFAHLAEAADVETRYTGAVENWDHVETRYAGDVERWDHNVGNPMEPAAGVAILIESADPLPPQQQPTQHRDFHPPQYSAFAAAAAAAAEPPPTSDAFATS